MMADDLTRYQRGDKQGSLELATQALPAKDIPIIKVVQKRRKGDPKYGLQECWDCLRGTHLRLVQRFSDTGFLDVGIPMCQSCMKRRKGKIKEALEYFFYRQRSVQHNGYGRQPYTEHCLSNLRDPGYE